MFLAQFWHPHCELSPRHLPPAFLLLYPGMLILTTSCLCTQVSNTATKAFSMAWTSVRRCNMCLGEPSVPPPEAAALAISPPSPPSGQTASDTTRLDSKAASGCLVDAGLMLGQTCRVCWAPNGTLVIPGQDSHSPFLCSAWDGSSNLQQMWLFNQSSLLICIAGVCLDML